MLVYELNDRFRTNIPTEQISCIFFFFPENVDIKEYLPRREGGGEGKEGGRKEGPCRQFGDP